MTEKTGYENHPGFEYGECFLMIKVRPIAYGTSSKGFACSYTGGHCLHCFKCGDWRKKTEDE